MFRSILAAAAAILLALGLEAPSAAAQDAEPPRNRLSPTDDTELPERTAPPLAPPQRLVPRWISDPQPPAMMPETKPAQAKQSHAAPKRAVAATPKRATKPTAKARRMTARRAPPRRVVAARPPRQDSTSLGALFTRPGTPPGVSPEAPPGTLTYNYLATPAAKRRGAPCATRSRTSLSALFTCAR
jgi:hypothetical protein